MQRVLNQRFTLTVALAIACAGKAIGSLPPYSITQLYSQNTLVSGSAITSPFASGFYGGPGFLDMAVNNSGTAYIHVGLVGDPPPPLPPPPGFFHDSNQAVLFTATGSSPFLFGGAGYDFPGEPGSVSVPSTSYIYDEGFWSAINNSGVGAFSLRLGANSDQAVAPVTGIYFSNTAMPLKEGDAVTAAGVAPGTVFAPFGPDRTARYGNIAPLTGTVQLNDNNVFLIAGNIIESGVTKRAIVKVAVNASGAVQSETLVAKEGGLVGTGPDTWATLSTLPNTCAINNGGQVLFSGTTTGGVDGIYLTTAVGGSFVARKNGPAPLGGLWGALAGAPVDLNNGGHFVFRGTPQGNGSWTELGDAGETFSSGLSFTANGTAGGGPLSLISGSLSNDYDVDVYYIQIGDPAIPTQVAFSATTVPDPGNGFAGAAFDTVLTLFTDAPNCNGGTRVGVGRCDDAAPGVQQSTLTTASLRSSHTPGAKYFLAISTPKARSVGDSGDVWRAAPDSIVLANGVVYWVDTGHGQIGRASTATGTLLAPLPVSTVPTGGPGSATNPPYLDSAFAVYDAGASSKIIFHQLGSTDKFRSCGVDGSGLADFTPIPTNIGSSGTHSMTFDSVHGKLYWATLASPWHINSCDADGNNAQVVYTGTGFESIDGLAVDPTGGKIYWWDSTASQIGRVGLDGSTPEVVLNAANAHSMSVDSGAQRLYYASTGGNKIGVVNTANLSSLADLVTTTSPTGVAVDAGAGRVYWSNPYERMLRRSLISSPAVENWLGIGADVGERLSDGPADFACAGVSGFSRSGAAGSVSLPYQIKLTGASYANQAAMICKDNSVKVVLGGDSLPATNNTPLTVVGATDGPLRISDRGLVAWEGRWVSSGTRTGLFLNTDKVIDDNSGWGAPDRTSGSLDMSSSGQHILVTTTNGSFTNAGVFCLKISFDSIPGCAPDYNGNGSLEVQDIFDFLNGWFAGDPRANFNGSANGLEVQDIFDFLNAWFAGC